MKISELIEKEAIKYSEEKWKHPSSNLSRAHCSLDYENGINSTLNKDLTELAVIEGKLYVLIEEKVIAYTEQNYKNHKRIEVKVEALKNQRTKLLNKLNLEG